MALRWAGTLISAILLGYLVLINWPELVVAVQQLTPVNLLSAFALVMLSRFFITLRWYSLLRFAGVPITLRQAISLTFTGLFANNFMPTTVGGDVMRLAGTLQLGFDQPICAASLAADRLVNMAGMSLAAPLGLIQLPQLMPAAVISGIWQKSWGFLKKTLASLTIWLKRPLSLVVALGLALAHMLCIFSANYILIHALGGELTLWQVIGLLSLSYFAGLLPISVGGYGWQEFTTSTLLAQVGGVSVAVSAAVALFQRVLMLAASLPGAITLPGVLASLPGNPKSNSNE